MNKIFLALAILALVSCRTTREIVKEKVVVDSSVVERNERLERTLKETVDRYEAERESWASTGVIFDTTYLPGDTVREPAKVVFHDNGRIKSVEGRLRSVTLSEQERTAELLDAHGTIDSLVIELDRKDAQLSKKVNTVTKEITKTALPFWVWLLLLAGFLVRHYWQKIKSII